MFIVFKDFKLEVMPRNKTKQIKTKQKHFIANNSLYFSEAFGTKYKVGSCWGSVGVFSSVFC